MHIHRQIYYGKLWALEARAKLQGLKPAPSTARAKLSANSDASGPGIRAESGEEGRRRGSVAPYPVIQCMTSK